VDTGGFGVEDADGLTQHIAQQLDCALASAALILFVVDAPEGVTPLDKAVAERLRHANVPVILVANKVDSPAREYELGEMASLGFGEALAVSALHRLGLRDLLEAVERRIGPAAEAISEPVMKLAIVGRRNVGKSTFVNALAGSERVIVAETPGTTRDSVDVRIELDGRTLLAIDTAGIRKRGKVADDVEFYGQHRALRSIRRADVVLFLMDAAEPVGRVDKQLVRYVSDLFKPAVLVVNKWDLAQAKADEDDYGPYLAEVLPEVAYAPIVFASAREGVGVREAVGLAGALFEQARQRVPTAALNAAVEEIVARHGPKAGRSGTPARLLYATQIAVAPPTLVCFVTDLEAFDAAYQRYLLAQFRQRLPFPEIPIRLIFRHRGHSPRPGPRKTRSDR
jgi:GTP-binding protein